MKQLSDDIVIVEGNNELNIEMTPIAAVVSITSASWELIDYPFAGVWEPLTAIFCKGTLQVESASEFVGRVLITCPYTIAPVPLLTAYGYQQVLAEIDDKIATSTGAIKELWQNRRAIFLGYPKVNGFTIDFRWRADEDGYFRSRINASPTEVFTLDDVLIPAGASTVEVGFFAKYGAAIGLFPVTVSLYSDETLLDSIESDLAPPENVPQVLSVDIPPVPLGGQVEPTITVRLPELRKNSQVYIFRAWTGPALGYYMGIRVAEIRYMSKSLVAKRVALGCSPTTYIALDAPDDVYVIKGIWVGWKGVWEYPVVYLSPGVYPVQAKVESWRVGVESDGCGVYWYGEPTNYNFGVVGELTVT